MELYNLHGVLVRGERNRCFKPWCGLRSATSHHHEQLHCCCKSACVSTAEMSMSGCPMSRAAEIAGLVIAATFFAKACKAFATTSAATGAVSRGRNRVPGEL